MIKLDLEDFMKKYNLVEDTSSQSDLQRFFDYTIHPRESKKSSNREFLKIDDGNMGGIHWNCFH